MVLRKINSNDSEHSLIIENQAFGKTEKGTQKKIDKIDITKKQRNSIRSNKKKNFNIINFKTILQNNWGGNLR